MFLSYPVHAPSSLYQPDNCPRQVVVYDYMTVLQVLPVTQYISCDKYPQFAFNLFAIAFGTETMRYSRGIINCAGYGRSITKLPDLKLLYQVVCCICKLGKD